MEERQITKVATCNLANLQKVALQWKIIQDFKPTAYLNGSLSKPWLIVTFGAFSLGLQYRQDNIALVLHTSKHADPRPNWVELKSTELPKVDEWTRIEISHEEEDGKFFFIFSVGGTQMGKKESAKLWTKLWTEGGLKINLFNKELTPWACQPGFVRGLVVVEK